MTLQRELFIHTQRNRPTRWDLGWLQKLVNTCRASAANSLVDLDLNDCDGHTAKITRELLHELRLVCFTPQEPRAAGFLETDHHFGVRYDHRTSHFDLTGIPQRWLRDLTWDHLADLLRSPRCPRSAGVIDAVRRSAVELGVFLAVDAPAADTTRQPYAASTCSASSPTSATANRTGCRRWLSSDQTGRRAPSHDHAVHSVQRDPQGTARRDGQRRATDRIGLGREFIVAVPTAGATTGRTARRPFPDEVTRALTDEENLARLAEPGICWTEGCVMSGRRPSSPAAASGRCSSFAGTASVATAA